MRCAGNSQLSITPASSRSIASAQILITVQSEKLTSEAYSELCVGQERGCAGRFSSPNHSARIAWEMGWEKADSHSWCGWVMEHSSSIWLKPSWLCSLWGRQHATNPKSPSGSCKIHKILPTSFLFCVSAKHLCPAACMCLSMLLLAEGSVGCADME